MLPLERGFWIAGLLGADRRGPGRRHRRPPRAAARAETAAGLAIPAGTLAPDATARLFGAGFAAFFLFAPILSERRDVPPGLLYTVYGVGIIATRIVGSGWLDRVGFGRTLLLSAILLGSGLALAAVATTPLSLAVASSSSPPPGLFHPVLIALHARLLPGGPARQRPASTSGSISGSASEAGCSGSSWTSPA